MDYMDVSTEEECYEVKDESFLSQPTSEKRKRQKYNFEQIGEKLINPETNQEFEIGDLYNGMRFGGYIKYVTKNGERNIKPLMRSEEGLCVKKRWHKREKSNPFLITSLASRLLTSARTRAKLRSEEVSLHRENIITALTLGWCQESYPPLPLVLDKPHSPYSPSLDRIDSTKGIGYSESNTRVVCNQINLARNNFPDEDTIKICKHLSEFLIRRRDKRSNSI
jgi:hypothetical protein